MADETLTLLAPKNNARMSTKIIAKMSPAERLARWSRLDPETGCIIFTGTLFSNTGYGSICINYKTRSAHRLAWELANGRIPDGKSILHRCDNPACVNPDHLFAGTQDDNMKDMMRKGRSSRGSRNNNAKMTEDQARAIKADLRATRTVADAHGVRVHTVWTIRTGRAWKHV